MDLNFIMRLKIIFTWWNRQTFGTFLKTLFFGKYVGVHTIDKIPDSKDFKHLWQKKHLENQTGTNNSFKPFKIRKNDIKKKYETWK